MLFIPTSVDLEVKIQQPSVLLLGSLTQSPSVAFVRPGNWKVNDRQFYFFISCVGLLKFNHMLELTKFRTTGKNHIPNFFAKQQFLLIAVHTQIDPTTTGALVQQTSKNHKSQQRFCPDAQRTHFIVLRLAPNLL